VNFAKSGRRHALSRGAKAIYHDAPSPITTDTAVALMKLHPVASDTLPSVPAGTPKIIVDAAALQKIIRRSLANGSTPGPSKWTGEMIADISDSPCLLGVRLLVQDLINGDIPRGDVRHQLLASRLVPIAKSDGGVRPIAMGEAIFKLAALYAISLIHQVIKSVFPCIQLGGGYSGRSRDRGAQDPGRATSGRAECYAQTGHI